jgi:outer membrane protein assembly factor BamB
MATLGTGRALHAACAAMMRLLECLALAVLTLAPSCGGRHTGTATALGEPGAAGATAAGLGSLASPRELMAVGGGPGAHYLTGDEYNPAWPNARVSADTAAARFAPVATSQPSLPDVAYAIYQANLDGLDTPMRLRLSWSLPPRRQDIWIACSDWERGRWVWLAAPANDTIAIPQLAEYADASGNVLLVVALTGGGPTQLRSLSILGRTDPYAAGWPEPGYNTQHTGACPYAGPESGTLLWTCELDGDVRCSPALAKDGTIYCTCTDGYLYAINPDGTVRWRYDATRLYASSPAIGPDGTIYFGTSKRKLLALNPDGQLRWQIDLRSRCQSAAPVIGPDGTIYFADSVYDLEIAPPRLLALSPAGEILWEFNREAPVVFAPPALGRGGTIYLTSDQSELYVLDSRGNLIQTKSAQPINSAGPVFHPNNTVIVGGYALTQFAPAREYEPELITINIDFNFMPAIGPTGLIYYVTKDERLGAITLTGTPAWQLDLGLRPFTRLAIDAHGTIYCGARPFSPYEEGGKLFAINPDGSVRWSRRYNCIGSAPIITPAGALITGTTGGLLAIGNNPGLLAAPDNFAASCGDFPDRVNLGWEHSAAEAHPSGYYIYRATASAGPYKYLTTTGCVTNYTDTSVEPSQLYFYRACAFTLPGSATSEFCEPRAGCCTAATGPGAWPMYMQNPAHTGHSPFTAPQESAEMQWSLKLNDLLLAAPVTRADGTLYTTSATTAYAVSPDGTLQWTWQPEQPGLTGSLGIGRAGCVLIGSEAGIFYGLNPDGTRRWAFDAGGSITGPPTIAEDGVIYFGCSTGQLYALDADGTQRWACDTGASITGSPALGADGTLYANTATCLLIAVDTAGNLRWSGPTQTGSSNSSPTVGADGTIYCGGSDQQLHAFAPDGTELWAYSTGGTAPATLALGLDGTVYCSTEAGTVFALYRNSTLRWDTLEWQLTFSQPLIDAAGNVLAVNPNGAIYSLTAGEIAQVSSMSEGKPGHVCLLPKTENAMYVANAIAAGSPSPSSSITCFSGY